ncbi:hypothetical protein HMPREF1624_06542 [Sporothrix schenckii ATCC 58251]|uniref:F-box domain-containing protein n=1 Tax=Sporothrix schenckii (strain ATCC 58251 / de Perez 2211183) TaxID=1391915 RepID=U7PQJ0_SPOS1|nr:hypothetical protein HMPREF1624_06542 [Sporothrix schenckii ATCC 58251]
MADVTPPTAIGLVADGDLNPDFQQPETIIEEQHHNHSQPIAAPMEDVPPKSRNRRRLFRGLSRMSSSSSLAQTGRARSASAPYASTGASLSCIALSSTSSPFAPSSSVNNSTLAFPPLSSTTTIGSNNGAVSSTPSPPSTATLPFPPFPHAQSSNAVRKVDLSLGNTSGTPGTVPMPHDMVRAASLPLFSPRPKKTLYQLWNSLPREIKLHILQLLRPKEIIRVSRVNKQFNKLCFDGQLWTTFDASEFYQDIPVECLSKIITAAGPFVKDLNLRGCVQIDKFQDALLMASACANLVNATLEGCLIDFKNLDNLLKRNDRLAHINLTGLSSVRNDTCTTLAQYCNQIEVLNLSWCKHLRASGIQTVLKGCPKLRDLRVGEILGFDQISVAKTFFETNRLERLVMSGCTDLTDEALGVMVHGVDPEIDLLTDRPIVPPRRLRHLDLSRCQRLTDRGVAALGHCVPDLEGLSLGACSALTDAALQPIFESTTKLAYLDLEDLVELTNPLFSTYLAKSKCVDTLTHMSISYCEDIGDAGMIPVLRACTKLRSVEMDNTRISDLTLAEAAGMVRTRAVRTRVKKHRPSIGLSLTVYDCPNVTRTGVREILSRNAEVLSPHKAAQNGVTITSTPSETAGVPVYTFPTEIIALKCFYGWQMTVDEHNKRVLKGDFAAAHRLERKWSDFIQANEEAGVGGRGSRRRRRRAREAQQAHVDEETAGGGDVEAGTGAAGMGIGRRRARTTACAIM